MCRKHAFALVLCDLVCISVRTYVHLSVRCVCLLCQLVRFCIDVRMCTYGYFFVQAGAGAVNSRVSFSCLRLLCVCVFV